MNIVQITTTIANNKRLDENANAWFQLFDETCSVNEDMIQMRPGLVLKRTESGRMVEFGGGHLVDGGFSYEFSKFGNDAKMVFLGAERDYGFGDIRLLIGDCEVSEVVIVQQLTVATKAWPK